MGNQDLQTPTGSRGKMVHLKGASLTMNKAGHAEQLYGDGESVWGHNLLNLRQEHAIDVSVNMWFKFAFFLEEPLSDLGSAQKAEEVFLSQQAVVCDEAGQIGGVSRRLVDCGMGLQLLTYHLHILRFTLDARFMSWDQKSFPASFQRAYMDYTLLFRSLYLPHVVLFAIDNCYPVCPVGLWLQLLLSHLRPLCLLAHKAQEGVVRSVSWRWRKHRAVQWQLQRGIYFVCEHAQNHQEKVWFFKSPKLLCVLNSVDGEGLCTDFPRGQRKRQEHMGNVFGRWSKLTFGKNAGNAGPSSQMNNS